MEKFVLTEENKSEISDILKYLLCNKEYTAIIIKNLIPTIYKNRKLKQIDFSKDFFNIVDNNGVLILKRGDYFELEDNHFTVVLNHLEDKMSVTFLISDCNELYLNNIISECEALEGLITNTLKVKKPVTNNSVESLKAYCNRIINNLKRLKK